MDELSFIKMIKPKTYYQSSLIKGIGDDAAVFREASENIVSAIDTFVEGVHFSNKTMDMYHVGYKVLAVNVSDMAAMGATPRYYLVSIVCPKSYSTEDYQAIFSGMRDFASRYKMDLIGGDTVSGNTLTVSVTVIGAVPKDKARYRSQAKLGDIVFVTGTLGDSQAGLHILLQQREVTGKNNYFIRKHQMPEPPIEFAKNVRNIERLALNDISDGIATEIQEIARASNVTMELESARVPVSQHFDQFPPDKQREWKLYGGEDFELLGTVHENEWDKVQKAAKQTHTHVTKIGRVTRQNDNENQVFLRENDQLLPLHKRGYTHLKDMDA